MLEDSLDDNAHHNTIIYEKNGKYYPPTVVGDIPIHPKYIPNDTIRKNCAFVPKDVDCGSPPNLVATCHKCPYHPAYRHR